MPIQSDVIRAADFNAIRDKVYSALHDNYGYSGMGANTAIAGNIIPAQQWQALYDGINRCNIHQTGAAITTVPRPQAGAPILAAHVSSMMDLATLALTNVATWNASQFSVSTDSASSINALDAVGPFPQWTSDRTHSVTHTWYNAAYAQYFFKLGNRIFVELSSMNNSVPKDATWAALITEINTKLATVYYGASAFAAGGTTTVKTDTIASGMAITVNFIKVGNTHVTTEVKLTNPGTDGSNINIISKVKQRYSNDLTGGVPTAGLPIATTTANLGTVSSITSLTRILAVTPDPITYNLSSGTGTGNTVRLTNNGNAALTVSAVTPLDPAGSGISYTTSGLPTLPFTIAVGAYVEFSLIYFLTPKTGVFNTALSIASDNDGGTVNTPVSITVTPAVFDFSFTPASASGFATDNSVITQAFGITYSGAYSPTFTTPVLTQTSDWFSLIMDIQTMTVYVTFNPTKHDTNSTYSASFALTLTGTDNTVVTRTATFTVVRNVINETRHLGEWISPHAAFNSIIGMSYDIIAGVRYLTVGVGVEGNQSDSYILRDHPTAATIANLGIAADSKYTSGIALYPIVTDSKHCRFLDNYGSWIRPNSEQPNYTEFSRSYTFTVGTAGTYTWDFSADNNGAFNIDGGPQLNTTSAYDYQESGTAYLTAGTHTVNFSIYNAGGPGGIAILIKDPSGAEVWSTRTPVRATEPYTNWSEVYRIPLVTTGTRTDYQSKNHYIKETWATEYNTGRWGDQFSDGSLFTVSNDGYGGVTININPASGTATGVPFLDTTVYSLPFSVYYYASGDIRYTQLDSLPINSNGVADANSIYTHQFTGFDRIGTTTTVINAYPTINFADVQQPQYY